MLHEKTPDQDGWYWIEDHHSGEWMMAYLRAEDDVAMLCIPTVEHASVEQLYETSPGRFHDPDSDTTFRPTRWIGPLGCPGGDFDSEIAEFTAEQHERAAREAKTLVMVIVNNQHAEDHMGQVTEFGFMVPDEALSRTAAIWRKEAEAPSPSAESSWSLCPECYRAIVQPGICPWCRFEEFAKDYGVLIRAMRQIDDEPVNCCHDGKLKLIVREALAKVKS